MLTEPHADPAVVLRALEPEDLDLLYQIENDRTLWSVGATNVPYSRHTLQEYIALATGDIYVDRQVRLMVCTPEGEAVGMVDLCNFNPQHNRAEVGIVIRPDCRRRGIGRAALRALVDYARSVLHLHQLYALVSQRHEATLRLFAQARFERQSTLADWLYDGREYTAAVVLQYFL